MEKTAATTKIIEVTSSTTQAKSAEMIEIKIRNLRAVSFLTRSIKPISQAKKPVSFKNPIRTIIPTRKRITSKEENLMICSKSIVLVTKRIDVPKKAKLKRKSQKKSVPKIEAVNMNMAVAWCVVNPPSALKSPKASDKQIRIMNFFNINLSLKMPNSGPGWP
jgi:hypothetical protein